MKLKSDIAVSEAGFVFNPLSGESFSVNQTGTFLLGLLKENCNLNKMQVLLCDNYECDKSTVEKDVRDFLSLLRGYNLLEEDVKN